MPAVEPLTIASFPVKSIFMLYLYKCGLADTGFS
jgi:hypothetical protein